MRLLSKIEIRLRRLVLRLPRRTLLILICILIGIVAGVSAFFLKGLLKSVHNFIQLFEKQNLTNIFLVVLPIIGLFLTVAYFSLFHKKGFKYSFKRYKENSVSVNYQYALKVTGYCIILNLESQLIIIEDLILISHRFRGDSQVDSYY